MPRNHRFARWFVAIVLIYGFVPLTFAATTKKLRYKFRYDLHLSDVHCWITAQCEGLVKDQADGAVADKLDRHMASAESSLDLAIYGVRQQSWMLERVGKLKRNGVRVRATIDQTTGALGDWATTANFPYPDAGKLYEVLGATALQPDRNPDGSPRAGSIMHNKFYVVDEASVWLGSTNLSDTGVGKEYNANSSIILYSPEIARLFAREFDQMFSQGRYSIHKSRHRLDQDFEYTDGTKLSVFFAPQDKPVDNAVVPFIASARQRLSIGIFYLTSQLALDALVQAHQRGVELRIINDATAARHPSSIVKSLRRAGIDVRVENWGGKMHMKTAVADGEHTLIGSMNWSDAGNTSNDEAVVVIRHHRPLASKIEEYLDSLWETLPSSTSTPKYFDPRAESLDSINSCFDGINNDHQGGTDLEVTACRR